MTKKQLKARSDLCSVLGLNEEPPLVEHFDELDDLMEVMDLEDGKRTVMLLDIACAALSEFGDEASFLSDSILDAMEV